MADQTGKIISFALKSIILEFKPRDILQVMIGPALLAMPVCLTEEAWVFGEELPGFNVCIVALISLELMAVFVSHNFYKVVIKGYERDF